MTPRRFGICIDANDTERVAEFWAAVLRPGDRDEWR